MQKENFKIEFTDARINTILIQFAQQHIKYHNSFFKSIIRSLEKNRSLTKKQWDQLNYLITKGRTMYEDGILTTKN